MIGDSYAGKFGIVVSHDVTQNFNPSWWLGDLD